MGWRSGHRWLLRALLLTAAAVIPLRAWGMSAGGGVQAWETVSGSGSSRGPGIGVGGSGSAEQKCTVGVGYWLSPDPAWLEQGPMGLNVYQYAYWNPIKFVDPDGRIAVLPILLGAAVSYAYQAYYAPSVANAPMNENDNYSSPDGTTQFLANLAGATGEGNALTSVLAEALVSSSEAGSAATPQVSANRPSSNAVADSQSGPSVRMAAKRGPKTDENAPHNKTIRAQAEKLVSEGNEVVAGGRVLKERAVPTPGGDKQSRRPDIIYRTPSGEEKGRNVGKTYKDGSPVKREQSALKDLNGPGKLPTDFVGY
jgi:hypothetical protein